MFIVILSRETWTVHSISAQSSQEGFQWKWQNIFYFSCLGPRPWQLWRPKQLLTLALLTKKELKAYCPKIFTVMGGASRCDWSHFSSAVLLVSLAVFSLYWEQVFVFKGRLSLVLYVAAADNAFGTHCNFSACCTLPQWAVRSMGSVIAKIVLQTPNLIILAVVLQILDFLSF